MLTAAETGRTGFAGTADRSTLKLDVRETPNGLRLSLPPLRPPGGCFQQARTGADDPLLTFNGRWRAAVMQRLLSVAVWRRTHAGQPQAVVELDTRR